MLRYLILSKTLSYFLLEWNIGRYLVSSHFLIYQYTFSKIIRKGPTPNTKLCILCFYHKSKKVWINYYLINYEKH